MSEICSSEPGCRRHQWADTGQSLKETYRPTGLHDPVQPTIHPSTRGAGVSYGLISLTPNPYSGRGEHIAVWVAGVHQPGTVLALKALAEADFSQHPLGGVIEVVHPGQTENAWWSWKTPSYSLEDVVRRLETASNKPQEQRLSALQAWTDEEVERCLQFCRGLPEVEPLRSALLPHM